MMARQKEMTARTIRQLNPSSGSLQGQSGGWRWSRRTPQASPSTVPQRSMRLGCAQVAATLQADPAPAPTAAAAAHHLACYPLRLLQCGMA